MSVQRRVWFQIGAFGLASSATTKPVIVRPMKRLTPFGVLLIFGLIGLLTGKFGLWFAFGLVACIAVSVMQNRSAAKTPPGDSDSQG